MKKINFLIKLRKEGKLKLVEPSEEIKESYLNKAVSYLDSAKVLLKNKKLEETVSLAYYSMYYSVLALLFRIGIKSENHSASIILLKELLGLDNRKISFARKERVDKQYYVDFRIVEREVSQLIEDAEEFNSMILDYIEKLTLEKIENLRKEFERLTWIDSLGIYVYILS